MSQTYAWQDELSCKVHKHNEAEVFSEQLCNVETKLSTWAYNKITPGSSLQAQINQVLNTKFFFSETETRGPDAWQAADLKTSSISWVLTLLL